MLPFVPLQAGQGYPPGLLQVSLSQNGISHLREVTVLDAPDFSVLYSSLVLAISISNRCLLEGGSA